METLKIPVKIRWWKKYKGLVLVPPRNHELKRKLMESFSSGATCHGILRAVMFGESWTFKVNVKFYTWQYVNRQNSHGMNTIFVINETDCRVCIENIIEYLNTYGNVNGVLTLYLP